MRTPVYRYTLIKRLQQNPSLPTPYIRPYRKKRPTPMAVDDPPLHELMDVDEWWWTPESDVTIDPVISVPDSGGPTAMDWRPELKGSPTPSSVQRTKSMPPPASGRLNRPKLKPLHVRREAVPQAAPSSTTYASAVSAAGSSGIGTKRPTDALAAHLRLSSQKRVATAMSPPTSPVKVDSLESLVRSPQSPATQKAPSPFGSPRLRPRGLEPVQEGLTQVDNELLSLLGEIESAPMSPPPQPQLAQSNVPVESSAAGQLIPEDVRPTRLERPQLKREGVLSEILEEAEEDGLFLEAP